MIQAWRLLFRKPDGQSVVDYLSGAICGGRRGDNATRWEPFATRTSFPISITKVSLKCWCRYAMRRVCFSTRLAGALKISTLNWTNDGLWMRSDSAGFGRGEGQQTRG